MQPAAAPLVLRMRDYTGGVAITVVPWRSPDELSPTSGKPFFQDDFVGHGCVVAEPYIGSANAISIHFIGAANCALQTCRDQYL